MSFVGLSVNPHQIDSTKLKGSCLIAGAFSLISLYRQPMPKL